MATRRKLSDDEKSVNRLRRCFEKNPSHGTYAAWLQACNHFRFTTEGANAYRHAAMEALIGARTYPSGGSVYADGYAYAKSLLDNAVLLERLVTAKLLAQRVRSAATREVPVPASLVPSTVDTFEEQVKSLLLISA